MIQKSKEAVFNRWFNVFILVGMLVAVALTNISELKEDTARPFMLALASIGAITGVVNSVLSANGKLLTFLFGFIDVSIASYVAFDSSIGAADPVWGNFALHAFYFLPMQFVGWWQWSSRGATDGKSVRARRMGWKMGLSVAAFVIAASAIAYFVLLFVSDGRISMQFRVLILIDAIVVVLNIVGQVLMSFAYMEQWILWILVNVFSVILWAEKAASSPDSSYTAIMVAKYVFYFLNSLNGLRIWLNLSRNRA